MATAALVQLAPVQLETADEAAKAALLKGMELSGGMIPNMFSRMANAPALLEMYITGYNSFRSQSKFSSEEQEVVLLTISVLNRCEYCIIGHRYMADQVWKMNPAISEAIVNGNPLPDTKMQALSQFVQIMVNKRGFPDQSEVNAFIAAGFTEHHILDIIQAIALKTISNYNNHLFNTPSDFA